MEGPLVKWPAVFLSGVVSAAVLGLWMMVYEWAWGDGFWAPLVYIGMILFIGRPDATGGIDFVPGPVLAGIVIHLFVALLLAFLFHVVMQAGDFRNVRAQMLLGLSYGALVFAVMWGIVVPATNDLLLRLGGVAFFFGHLAWGVVLGGMNAVWSRRAEPAAARRRGSYTY